MFISLCFSFLFFFLVFPTSIFCFHVFKNKLSLSSLDVDFVREEAKSNTIEFLQNWNGHSSSVVVVKEPQHNEEEYVSIRND